MAVNSTTNLGLALPDQGEWDGTWGTNTNAQITELIDSAVAGTTTLSADVDVTLTDTDFVANQSRQAIILWTASNGATTRNVTAPARSKVYVVINAGTGSIVLRGAGPTTGITIIAGEKCVAAWNGSDFVKMGTTDTVSSISFGTTGLTPSTATKGAVTVAGTLAVANGGTGVTTATGTGSVVKASAPTLSGITVRNSSGGAGTGFTVGANGRVASQDGVDLRAGRSADFYDSADTISVRVSAPNSISSSYVLYWPTAQASAAGQALVNDGVGNLSWASQNSYGSWTPTLIFGAGGSPVSATVSGYYTKNGRLVTLFGKIEVTSISGSGYAQLGGFPFTSASGFSPGDVVVQEFTDGPSSTLATNALLFGSVLANNTKAVLYTGWDGISTYTSADETTIHSGAYLAFRITYLSAS